MGSSGTIPLKDVWALLEQCASGYTKRARTHNWLITYNDKSFPALPLGAHGKRENPRIQIGHIRHLVRQLGIADCAKSVLPALS